MALDNQIALFDFGGFEGGLNRESDPFTVGQNESPDALNVNFLLGGSVRRRKGYQMAVQWGFIPPDPAEFEAFFGLGFGFEASAENIPPSPSGFEAFLGIGFGFDLVLEPGKLVPPGLPVATDLQAGSARSLTVVHVDVGGVAEVATDLQAGDARVLTIVHADVNGHMEVATELEADR